MAKNKVSLSFSKRNLDLYNVLKSKENSSSYVCNLIRKDMEKYYTDMNDDFEAKVEQALEKLLKDKQLIYSGPDKLPEESINRPTNEDVDLILSIF